jgi:isopenicillin N synthase-like dioxygenase
MITATSSGDAASEDALQVRNARGEYVSAPPLPDAFICNVGDMLHIASGGVYASTPHRVVHAAFRGEGEGKGEGETALPPPRTSVAVFYEPHFNARIEPAAVASSGAKSVDAKHYGAHLEAKVLSNFEL